MKSFSSFYFLISFFIVCSCKQGGQESQTANTEATLNTVTSEVQLGREKAGKVEINMDIAQVESIYGTSNIKKSTYTSEGQSYEGYFVHRPNKQQPSLRLDAICTDNCKIWRIKVMDSAYKTETGIGIGSTIKDIKSYHFIDAVGKTESEPSIRIERLGMSFQLDSSSIASSIIDNLAMENLPDSARVKSIIITEAAAK